MNAAPAQAGAAFLYRNKKIVFYEVTPDMKYMKEINRIQPEKGFIGVHTMNPYKNLIVWDAKKYRYPIIAKCINTIIKMFGRI